MGVSMGIIKPMEGKAAQDFLRDSQKRVSDKDAMKKCKELSKLIIKRY